MQSITLAIGTQIVLSRAMPHFFLSDIGVRILVINPYFFVLHLFLGKLKLR